MKTQITPLQRKVTNYINKHPIGKKLKKDVRDKTIKNIIEKLENFEKKPIPKSVSFVDLEKQLVIETLILISNVGNFQNEYEYKNAEMKYLKKKLADKWSFYITHLGNPKDESVKMLIQILTIELSLI